MRRRLLAGAIVAALVTVGILAERSPALFPLKFSIQRTPDLLPSSTVIPESELRRGLPTVSLAMTERDLYDPATGILANKRQHGRAWERPATISYLEDGRVLFASTASVRVHGGGSRLTSKHQGYRVYFRRGIGATSIPPGVVFGPPHAHPVRVLIVHNDVRTRGDTDWALVNPLAFDIVDRVGGIASPSRPVRFLLNGQFLGVFVLYEHFHPNHYFPAHGRRDVHLNAEEFQDLYRQVRSLDPVTMETAGALVDLESLIRWFIATAFCATRDAFQGPGQFRDASRAGAQWFWVNWDMDGSFADTAQNPFRDLLIPPGGGRRGRRRDEVRPYLMTELLRQDPAYKELFKVRWVEAMNHRITPAFLRERFEHYRDVAVTYGVERLDYLPMLERFLSERPAVVRGQVSEYLQAPTIDVRLGSARPILIDGHEVSGRFDGYYFRGMKVVLDVPDRAAGRFSFWQINGQPMAARQTAVTVTADEDLRIQAIWR